MCFSIWTGPIQRGDPHHHVQLLLLRRLGTPVPEVPLVEETPHQNADRKLLFIFE